MIKRSRSCERYRYLKEHQGRSFALGWIDGNILDREVKRLFPFIVGEGVSQSEIGMVLVHMLRKRCPLNYSRYGNGFTNGFRERISGEELLMYTADGSPSIYNRESGDFAVARKLKL